MPEMKEYKCKKVIKILAGIICASFLMILTGCKGCSYNDYSGEHTDLYTVAVNSILWNEGHSSSADRFYDAEIEILETDTYGRVLYTYYEKTHDTIAFSSLIITQYSSGGYVYYYEDYNYLIKEQELYSLELQRFGQEEIENLKTLNDWGKELNLKKCTKKEIIRDKQRIPTNEREIEEKVCLKFGLAANSYIGLWYLTSDTGGNFIVYGDNSNNNIRFAAFVNSEGNVIDWLVPQNLFAYQEELKNFKLKNGWVSQEN